MNAPYIRPDLNDFNDDDGVSNADTWQPLGAVLRREARRLELSRATAIAVFEAAGINLNAEI